MFDIDLKIVFSRIVRVKAFDFWHPQVGTCSRKVELEGHELTVEKAPLGSNETIQQNWLSIPLEQLAAYFG